MSCCACVSRLERQRSFFYFIFLWYWVLGIDIRGDLWLSTCRSHLPDISCVLISRNPFMIEVNGSIPTVSFLDSLYSVYESISFYHESFRDFLGDPARSGISASRLLPFTGKFFFSHLVQQHQRPASSYVLEGETTSSLPPHVCSLTVWGLALAPDVTSFSASFSWPH